MQAAWCALVCSCWSGPQAEPAHERTAPTTRAVGMQCEKLSPQASLLPADGGYRRLERVGRDSLYTAISDAARRHPFGERQIGGRAFVAAVAAVHDLRPELVKCMHAADGGQPDLRYTLRLTITGDRNIGALIDDVSLKRIVLAPDQPPTEVPTAAEKCFADLLDAIELPQSDGPGYVHLRLSERDPCVASRN